MHAWTSAGFRLQTVRLGESVTFVPNHYRTGGVSVTAQKATPAEPNAAAIAAADVVLVSCAKTKRATPGPAKDLYVSPLFRGQRRYAEDSGRPWFILSAEHGLLAPEEWLAPYERYLPDTPPAYRDAWGQWVVARLELLQGPLRGRVVEVHAGAHYANALAGPLEQAGARMELPLEGLSHGQRLHWYAVSPRHEQEQRVEGGSSRPSAAPDASASVDDLVEGFIHVLGDPESAVTVPQLLASDRGPLQRPGLYSWWVDAEGAHDLSRALDGQRVGAGLIYAGQAGATRWPSGRRSSNTLWGRVVGMHLGKKHEFSTFRRTLAALLAPGDPSGPVDETALTSWMTVHLRVVASPIGDPDVLGVVEHAVLQRLDPPLNLKGMSTSPVREELKRARQPLGRHRSR
ncbi:hypothetical protein GCM10009858_05970 [Terrabacter carboxydivorans]|uniref:Uncharacterized protein n=1 Tax=Terrabacter carboxydivorans TaxID=619730 RepID=A0ABP5Y1V4_9MICO